MPVNGIERNPGHFAHVMRGWASGEINRNRQQGEHYEHLDAEPFQLSALPCPVNQQQRDRHRESDHRDMI